MKKIFLLIAVIAGLFSCTKKNSTQVTLVGKWHLVADTVQTFSASSPVKTEYNTNTKASLSDLEFEPGENFYVYNGQNYSIQPTYLNSGNSLTLNYPAIEGGAAAVTKVATIKLLTAGRLLLFFPPASTNGTYTTLDFIKLAVKD